MMGSRILIFVLGAVLLAKVCPSSEVPQNDGNQDQTAAASSIDESSEANLNQHEEDDYYQEFLGVPMASSTDDFGVKGRPGIDFPNLAAIPLTSFTCRNVKESGYFADMETKCQVFHICDGGRKMSFLCPNGTIFRQSHLICDWWFRVDCEDSQNYYEPSADTLRRDRERGKHDRMPSESRESMSITADFRPHQNVQQYVRPNVQDGSNIFYEPGQPLHLSNRRISTIDEQVTNDEGKNGTPDQNRRTVNLNSQYYQHKQQNIHEPQSYQRDSGHKKVAANFRSVADNGHNVENEGNPKVVIEDGIIRAVKQTEANARPNSYFEPEDPIKTVSQLQHSNSENASSHEGAWNSESDESVNRRADKMRRIVRLKVKSNKNIPAEGQVLAETSSYAGSHRRGLTQDRRLQTVTFSQVTESIPIFDLTSRKEVSYSATANRSQYPTTKYEVKSTNDNQDSVVTYRPPNQREDSKDHRPSTKNTVSFSVSNETVNHDETEVIATDQPPQDEDIDSVVTYRPVMDLEKFLNQRRERLTKDDTERDGKPYTGTRKPANLPLSSSPGAVHSLALYIESLSDDQTYGTPRRIHGNLRGIIPTDPVPTQKPRTSLHVERESIYSSQKQHTKQQHITTASNPYESVSFIKYNDPQSNTKVKNGSREIPTNINKPTTVDTTDENAHESEVVFESYQRNVKDSGVVASKHNSKTEINHKKSHLSNKKMKDYLLGNFTSEDSGLFQHINKALSESNSSLTKDSMEILYKNAIEPVLKEAMSLGSITESELVEMLTTEEASYDTNTDSPTTTEDYINQEKLGENEKYPHKETIQLTPFFKVENGKITSTSSKFPEDEDLSKTPSDLRELAQVFSRALSAYLEDPETFREALASVSHPNTPVLPIRLTSSVDENTSNSTKFKEEEDEVLDFSDVQTPTTTTTSSIFQNPTTTNIAHTTSTATTTPYYTSDTTSSKIQTGFYITIPFITPTHKTPERDSTNNVLNNNSHQDAEGPELGSIQTATTATPEISTKTDLTNASLSLRGEKSNQQNENNLSLITEQIKRPSGALLEENFPPLETKILPPFQDAIPDHESVSQEEENGYTDINIPTAALDEILNEFVPEELNRLAMTSIEPEEIPDDNKYLSSYADSLEPNSLGTTDFLNENGSTTPATNTTSTTPLTPTTDLASQTVNDILSRITAKLPQMTTQSKKNLVNSQFSTVPYDTYANHLLKTVINPATEKDESLVRAQSANFLPSQPNSNTLSIRASEKISENSTPPMEESNSLPTERYVNEKTTPGSLGSDDFELLPSSSVATPVRINFPTDRTKILNATEVLSLNGGEDGDRSHSGNPRLVLLFVNDRSAKGIGLNEKNARLLKALLRKDDHHILQSVGLIPEDSDTREPTTSTVANNSHEGTSAAPPHIILKVPSTTTTHSHAEPDNAYSRTEPPITTYAPKFTIPWYPIKKVRSPNRNQTARAQKLQVTDPPESVVETTTPTSVALSEAPKYLPDKQITTSSTNSTGILGEDKSTVSDGRAFDLLRSLYSLTARWG